MTLNIALFILVVEYPGPPSGKNTKITLKVSLRGFDEVRSGRLSVACTLISIPICRQALVKVDTTSLNPNAEVEILASLSSSESLQECASKLRSVFSEIGANVEVLQNVIQVLENVASVSCRSFNVQ